MLQLLYPSTIHGEEEGATQENIFTSAAELKNPVPGPSSDVQLQLEDDDHHNNNDDIDLLSSLESSN